MTKFTLGVLIGAVGLLGYMGYNYMGANAAQEEAAKPITIDGYLSEAAQSEFEKRQDNPILFLEESKDDRKALFETPPYDELILANNGEEVRLKRVGEGEEAWQIADSGTPVDKTRITAILDLFATNIGLMPVRTLAKKNSDLLGEYGLNDKRMIRIELKQEGVTKVALLVGDRDKKESQAAEQAGTEQYDTFTAIPDKLTQIYRAKQRDLRTPLDIRIGDLRSKRVFSFEAKDIAQITIQNAEDSGEKRIVLNATWPDPNTPKNAAPSNGDGKPKDPVATYQMSEPSIDNFRLTNLKSYWSSIANLRASKFVIGSKPTEETGLLNAEKSTKISVTTTGENPQTIQLVFGAPKEKDKLFYAQVQGTDEYMVLSKYARDNLIKSLDDLRDKNVLAIDKKEDINRIEIQNEHTGETSMVFVRRDTDWHMTAPLDQRPSQNEVKGLVSGLQYLRAADFLSDPSEADKASLAKPSLIVTMTIKDKQQVLQLGAEHDSKVLAHLKGTNLYFNVSSWTKNKFNKKPEELRNKVVLELNGQDIQSMVLKHSDQTVALERIAGETSKWKMTAPEPRTAANGLQDATVNGIANTIKQLTVKSFTDKTSAQANLDTPIFTLQATLKDGSTRAVFVSEQGEENDHFVRVDSPTLDSSAVYLVDEPQLKNIQKRLTDLVRTGDAEAAGQGHDNHKRGHHGHNH